MPNEPSRGWQMAFGIAGVVGVAISLIAYQHSRTKDAADEKRAARAEEKDKTYGKCSLKMPTPANVHRLNKFIEEGQYYKALGSFDVAEHRFQQVLDIDPNYLGANQDLGVTQMASGDLTKAQVSFDKELNTIDCLRSLSTGELDRFAYWLGQNKTSLATDTIARQELDKAEDSVHYNMACAFVKQKQQAAALDELRKAAEHHSIHRSTIAQDPDLRPIRISAGYESVLALFG